MFALNSANVILYRTTIKPASVGISVGGQIVTAAPADGFCVDRTGITTGPTGAILVSHTAAKRVTNLTSNNEAFPGGDPACLVAADPAELINHPDGKDCSSRELQKGKEKTTGRSQWRVF